jgi:branched-chain amino acid transport system permease protein
MTSPNTISASGAPWRAGLVILATAVAVLAVIFAGDYAITILALAGISAIFVTGLNLFMGYAGQVSFGQNAFAAVGAYTSAILCARLGWDPALAMVVATALSCLLAAIIGYPTLTLRGHYLAMATFALGLMMFEVTVQWRDLTEGFMGIGGIPKLGIAGYALGSDRAQLAAIFVFVAAGLWVAVRLKSSRFGRALAAVAGSEDAAAALGVRVSRYKLAAFVLAAAYASISGSLYAHFVGFISPEVFGLMMVLQTFTMIFVGGLGTVFGPALGALIITILPEAFRGLNEYQDLAYGGVLLICLIFAPRGLASLLPAAWRDKV